MKRASIFFVLLLAGGIALLVGAEAQSNDPAPDEDRVGFPDGYRDNYRVLWVFDQAARKKNVQILYGNDLAASARPGEPFPYGSVLVQEGYRALVDARGEAILDENGRYQPGELIVGLGVMRKEEGFGEAYKHNRAGEWEFVVYDQVNGGYDTPPQKSAPCAACHQLAGKDKDYAYRMSLFHSEASGALPNSIMQHQIFVPNSIPTNVGGTVTWYNYDEVLHHIVLDNDSTVDSGNMRPGSSFSHRFDAPGSYGYHCLIHPPMKGTVVVTGNRGNQ